MNEQILIEKLERLNKINEVLKPLEEEQKELKKEIQMMFDNQPIKKRFGNFMLNIYSTTRSSGFDDEAFQLAHPVLARTLEQINKTREKYKKTSSYLSIKVEEQKKVDLDNL
jgi:Tfp pilus assembly protein PilO